MAAQNRHLSGESRIVLGKVFGDTVIEAGDLLILNNQDGTCGNSVTTLRQADNYVFPLDMVMSATAASEWDDVVSTQFIGFAVESSAGGTTEDISVATAGTVRYPLLTMSAVTIGSKMSAASPAGGAAAGNGTSRQTVVNENTQSTIGSTAYLGYCVKTESGASFVDFEIWSGIFDGQLT